jgi:hypothetical protein
LYRVLNEDEDEEYDEQEKKHLCSLWMDRVDIIPRLYLCSTIGYTFPFGNGTVLGKRKEFAVGGLFL